MVVNVAVKAGVLTVIVLAGMGGSATVLGTVGAALTAAPWSGVTVTVRVAVSGGSGERLGKQCPA